MQPGTLLAERFRLEAHRERSRAGEVYLASDLAAGGTPCLVEVIALSGFNGADTLEQLEREVAVGARLEGPDLLLALGWGQLDPEHVFVVRALRDGARPLNLMTGTVEQRIRRLLRAARLVEHVAGQGAVHRDLGPLTILEGPGEEATCLSGFGRALLPGVPEPPLNVRGMRFSYLPCAAPELLDSPEDATPTADVYALGVLLHMILCGVGPYPGPTLIHLIRQQDAVRYGTAPAPQPKDHRPGLPEGLNAICARALSLDPALRTPSARTLVDELEQWLEVGGPIASTEAQPAKRSQADLLSEALSDSVTTEPTQVLAVVEEDYAEIVNTDTEIVEDEPPPTPVQPRKTLTPATRDLWDPFASDEGGEVLPAGEAPSQPAEGPEETSPKTVSFKLELPSLAQALAENIAGAVADAVSEPRPQAEPEPAGPEPQVQPEPAGPESGPVPEPEPEPEPQAKPEPAGPEPQAKPEPARPEPGPVAEPVIDPMFELEESEPVLATPPAEESLEDSSESVPEPLSPDEALAAIERETKRLTPAAAPAPGVATEAEVLAAFGPPSGESEDMTPMPASPAEVLAALEQQTRAAAAEPEPVPVSPAEALAALESQVALEDEPTDIVPALPDKPPGAPAQELSKTDSGRVDLGALDLLAKAQAPPRPEPATDPAPLPQLSSALPPVPDLPRPEPEPLPPDLELLPPVAFDMLQPHDTALVLTMPAKEFEPAVSCAKQVDMAGFGILLLDMSAVPRLGGNQLEALTEVLTWAERKQAGAAMFGLKPDVRQLLRLMDDMAQNLPRVIEAADVTAALALAK